MAKAQEAENMAAVLEWCRICRPDMLPQLTEMIDGSNRGSDAFTLLLAIGFDAGRDFQHENPECPLGPIMPGGDWKPITNAVYQSRGETSPETETADDRGDPSCDCGHIRDQHNERGYCDECDCSGFAPGG